MAFLNIPTVRGEATASGHAAWIELHSYRPAPVGRTGDFDIVKPYDSASPVLMKMCASGQKFDATIDAVLQNRIVATYHLKEAIIAQMNFGGNDHGKPLESLTFNCLKIEMEPR